MYRNIVFCIIEHFIRIVKAFYFIFTRILQLIYLQHQKVPRPV